MGPLGVVLLLGLAGAAFWKVFSKAGYHGAMGLLMLVPFVNLLTFVYFVFAEWPIQRQWRALSGLPDDEPLEGQG